MNLYPHNPRTNGATEPCDALYGEYACSCGAWHVKPVRILPMPPRVLPMPPQDVRQYDVEIARNGKMTVKKIDHNKLEVRVGNVADVLTRNETFRLIGMLERVGASL